MIKISEFCDERGVLTVVDEGDLPFPVKRVFWINGKKDAVRGGHGHRHNRQILLAISGKVTVRYLGSRDSDALLVKRLTPSAGGLLLEPWQWHEMYFESDDAMLLVLASMGFDSDDYVMRISDARTV